MKKNKIFIVTSLAALLVVFSACDSSDEQSKASSDEPEVDKVSENEDESKDPTGGDTESSEENEKEKQDEVNAEEKSAEDNNQSAVAGKQENTKTEQTTNTDENQENPSEPEENIQITSGEEAVQFLKQHLKEGKNDDVSFGATETSSTDDYGSYYTVQLVDVPTRVSGKTGTLGTYKVYQDGTYKDFYDDLN
ncbi:hypothetical protein CIL05_12150 [Virgibacillus profundi]|uniref:Lipoprotein n=1 Tax=Virgibacillus profundi TaxID=2024555 RepID=A0A2A2IBZ9_9BACI|nr:hypothetical protein [Virgibacillus profundi]PAV29147.1 hypothetical protein CIL05_12150 [Virgibacillus profundi]PXY53316.1 hypothetical protein CIT14_12275 [Virgibacillus profundi]